MGDGATSLKRTRSWFEVRKATGKATGKPLARHFPSAPHSPRSPFGRQLRHPRMSLAGKRVAVLAEFNVEDMELAYPRLRFLEEGCAVSVVGPKAKFKYAGKHGYPFVSDLSIDEARAEDFDCLIIPGGFAPDYWRRDERFKQLVRDMDEAGKYIGSICHGPWLLISAKVIKGRTVTCFHAIKDDVENAGATYVEGKEVVVDGNLVTSRTPDDLPAFCRTLIAMLSHQ